MEERVEIPKNAKELANYLEEVLERLEIEGKIRRDTGSSPKRKGISLEENAPLAYDMINEQRETSY